MFVKSKVTYAKHELSVTKIKVNIYICFLLETIIKYRKSKK